jgi:F-type H+-transporting ATPase subunit gamma
MATAREVRLRIRSVENIAQVTRALQTISASRVRKAQQAVLRTRPFAEKAWQVLQHISQITDRDFIHPLLSDRESLDNILVIMISGDRGLAGAYNTNILRFTLDHFLDAPAPVHYAVIGRKGRDVMFRQGMNLVADFTDIPAKPTFLDTSAIGQIALEEFLERRADQVFIVYTDFVNLLRQIPTVKKLLPLQLETSEERVQIFEHTGRGSPVSYIYEPGQAELLDYIIPRFTQLQVYQAILESQASEHAARMVAMQNATDNAHELSSALRLEYNKARQLAITSDMMDIVGGAEALKES